MVESGCPVGHTPARPQPPVPLSFPMLDAGAIERLCLSFPGVELSIQWGGQRVFKIGGRMFATIGSREPHRVSFKCNEIAFHTLTRSEERRVGKECVRTGR